MGEKKMVSRSVAIGLGIICIVLIAGVGGAMAYYTVAINGKNSTINSKDATINQLDATIADQNNTIASLDANITTLTNEKNQLQTWLDGNETLLNLTEVWLNGNITYYNSQITNLQNQLINFTDAKPGFTDLTAVDNRTNPEMPFLNINGTIHNFGIDSTPWVWEETESYYALIVKAYHNDGSVALETTLENSTILSINGQSSINVDLNYYYNGSALASWTVTFQESFVI
jgi:uncharacterized coiled-coil protein SlyX